MLFEVLLPDSPVFFHRGGEIQRKVLRTYIELYDTMFPDITKMTFSISPFLNP